MSFLFYFTEIKSARICCLRDPVELLIEKQNKEYTDCKDSFVFIITKNNLLDK